MAEGTQAASLLSSIIIIVTHTDLVQLPVAGRNLLAMAGGFVGRSLLNTDITEAAAEVVEVKGVEVEGVEVEGVEVEGVEVEGVEDVDTAAVEGV